MCTAHDYWSSPPTGTALQRTMMHRPYQEQHQTALMARPPPRSSGPSSPAALWKLRRCAAGGGGARRCGGDSKHAGATAREAVCMVASAEGPAGARSTRERAALWGARHHARPDSQPGQLDSIALARRCHGPLVQYRTVPFSPHSHPGGHIHGAALAPSRPWSARLSMLLVDRTAVLC